VTSHIWKGNDQDWVQFFSNQSSRAVTFDLTNPLPGSPNLGIVIGSGAELGNGVDNIGDVNGDPFLPTISV
jgi:hypothetical protein